MGTQPEQVLENQLIAQLAGIGYEKAPVSDEPSLLANFKKQLELHNGIAPLTDNEFEKVLTHLKGGSVFEKAKKLRDKMSLELDSDETIYLEFLNTTHWCQNRFQVASQISMKGMYKNRYDVTLLINGLPLVQIELKRRGLELKEAFKQNKRYQAHSFGAGMALFQYIQLFIISNGVNTKYYANNRKQTFKQTFYWADKENKKITQLASFAADFLEPCHVSKMICKYTVLQEANKILMVLRPYQYYATEAIVERVKNTNKNGYIWHTTGSGKTLTSFKASQVLISLPEIYKVVFVVDRKDLDYQTIKEFDSFSKGSVDATDNTGQLIKQFNDDTRLIVTTIQKLNNAIHNKRYISRMESLQDKKIVFIFDECHRSQFGDTHKRIKAFFHNHQMFGFTGTPIFADNAARNQHGKRTTADLFDACLHKYVITDAIRDENVLKFSVEYVGKYKRKDSANEMDIEVEDIDSTELMESPKRLSKIADYIIANHDRKTQNKYFTAMFCVSGVDVLIKYYEILKEKKQNGEHDLKIATIFSYVANQEDKNADGFIDEEPAIANEPKVLYGLNKHSREKLDEFIEDYNQMFQTKYSTKDSDTFYNYYQDIAKKVKHRQVDILLVVNMFLTGFDSPGLNTLYVDKNLRYHGLIQAFSRTNRIVDERKSQGNIVSFRNLKDKTDEAITLFSNKEAIEVIIMEPYEDYVEEFNEKVNKLISLTPTIDSVNDLIDEDAELEFVKAFRELMRVKNVLNSFANFEHEDLDMDEQTFEDYKSKYLDIYDKVRTNNRKEKVSILNDVDFELELIHRDEINVAYILKLLANLKDTKPENRDKQRKEIVDMIAGETHLRSKRTLIEKFISENMPKIKDSEHIESAFHRFWEEQQQLAFEQLCEEENLDKEKLTKIVSEYIYTEKEPLRDDIIQALHERPSLLKRKTIAERIIDKVIEFVETFVSGIESEETD